jgi:hypothetical protein
MKFKSLTDRLRKDERAESDIPGKIGVGGILLGLMIGAYAIELQKIDMDYTAPLSIAFLTTFFGAIGSVSYLVYKNNKNGII